MKYPEKVTGGPVKYYTVILWPRDGGSGTSLTMIYKTEAAAIKRARAEIEKDYDYTSATIRRVEVYRRDNNIEISASGRAAEIFR